MNGVMHVIDQSGPALTQALAWFIGQGLVIGVLALAAGWILRKRSAQVRYVVHLSALALMLACLPANLLLLPAPVAVAQAEAVETDTLGQNTAEQALLSDIESGLTETSDPAIADGAVTQPWVFPPSGHVRGQGVEQLSPPIDSLDSGPDGLTAWPPPTFDLQERELNRSGQEAVGAVADVAATSSNIPLPTLWQRLSPWVVGVYAAGLVAFLLRLLVAFRGGRRLRRAALPVGREGLVWSVFQEQAERLGVSLKHCPGLGLLPDHFSAPGPMLMGLMKPMILLPAAAVTQLTPAQLEAVIAHELAHLKRHDPWLLMFQRVVETLLFFHPMVWIVSARASFERENACDDMVLASGAKPADYASALVQFLPKADLSASPRNVAIPATAAAAVSSSRSLRRRILRLFGEPTSTPIRLTRKGLAACAFMVLMSAMLVALACQSARPGGSHMASEGQSESDSEERAADTDEYEEDRMYWSTANPADPLGLGLDGTADRWSLSPSYPRALLSNQTVYTIALTEFDWHTLSPGSLVSIVDAATSDDRPGNIGQLVSGEAMTHSSGLPIEQVYQTHVIGYRTQSGSYGMLRVEHHPFAAVEEMQGFVLPGKTPRFAQVKRIVEEPDRFDVGWHESIAALDMNAGESAINFVGETPAAMTYDNRFPTEPGATYVLTARGHGGFSALELIDAEGNVLATGHDRWHDYDLAQGITQPQGRRIRLIWTAPEDSIVTARVRFGERGRSHGPPDRDTGGYTLDVRCLTTRPKVEPRSADAVPYDHGAIERIEFTGSAVMHRNTPPRFGMYYLPDMQDASFRLFDLLQVAGFDLNQVPYHRFDVVRSTSAEGERGRLVDVPVFFDWQLGREVTQDREPVALRPGDQVIVRPRELFAGEEKDNLDREALGWGLPVDGLMCRWKETEAVIHPGQVRVPLTVQVRNVSPERIVWESHWLLGRMSREAMVLVLRGASNAADPGAARQGSSYSVVMGRGADDYGISYSYLRGGRMADEDEADHGPRTSGSGHPGPPGGRVHYRPGVHFLPPGAVVEMTIAYPVEQLEGVGGSALGIPSELFAEVPRYNPYTSVIRSMEEGSMTCPPLAVRVLPGEAEPQSRLGPTIERDMSRRTQYLDLDNGAYIGPAGLNEAAAAGMWFIGPQGNPDGRVNLFHNPLSSTIGLSGRYVQLVPLGGMAFGEVRAEDIELCWDDAGFVASGKQASWILTPSNGAHAFRTLAGRRGVVELVQDEDAAGVGWTVRLRHLPRRAPFTEPGDTVEGVSVHLHGVKYHNSRRVEQPDGTTRPELTFNLRARHDGNRKLHLPENPLRYQLCVDGEWYAFVPPQEVAEGERRGDRDGRLLDFDPMSLPAPFGLPITRELRTGHWYAIPEGEEGREAKQRWGGTIDVRTREQYGDPLVLTPGEHTVHLAITFGPARAIEGHDSVRVVSNPMCIRVPEVERKDAEIFDADQPAWGEPVDGVRAAIERVEVDGAGEPVEGVVLRAVVEPPADRVLQLANHAGWGCRLEVDGVWYRAAEPSVWRGPTQTPSSSYVSGSEFQFVMRMDGVDQLDQPRWRSVDGEEPLALEPGAYVVRFAWRVMARGDEDLAGPDVDEPMYLHTGAIQVKVDDADVVQAGARVVEPVPFGAALVSLYEGVDRREAARHFRALVPWIESRMGRSDGRDDYRRAGQAEALRLADLLDAMAEEDGAWEEPADLDALTQDELIAYHIYHLRDVAGKPMSVPGKVNLLGGGFGGTVDNSNAPAQALRDIAKPAIPALIALLGDERPLRCISTGLNGNHALRYRDAAVQILSAIAGRRFMPHVNRGVYFSNAPEDIQQQVVRDIEQWWVLNRERTEADWLRDAIVEEGVGRNVLGDDRVVRLIAFEGRKVLGLFRERMKAEPENGTAVRVFWQAAMSEGPAEPGVLDEIRAITESEHPGPRAAAYRILLEHGTDDDCKQIIPRLVKEIEAIAKLEDWSWRGVGFNFCPEDMITLLCRDAQPAGFDQASKLLDHADPRIVDVAIDELLRAYPAEIGPALEQEALEHITAGLLRAIKDRTVEQTETLRISRRYQAAIWLHRQYNLIHLDWNHRRIDVSVYGPTPTDEQKAKMVETIIAWFQERVELKEQGLAIERRRPHDSGITIVGRVLDKPDGEPVAGVTVTLTAPTNGSTRRAVTDEQGEYAFSAVPSIGMAHTLQVGRHGPGVWTDDVYLYVQSPEERLDGDEIQANDLYAKHPNTLTGRVIDAETGEGIPRYPVRIKTSFRSWGSFVTDEHGAYRINTAAGEVSVECDGDMQRYYGPSHDPQDGENAEPGRPATQTFGFEPSQAIQAGDFKLQPAPAYSIRVLMPDGSPAQGVEVYVLKMYTRLEPFLDEGHSHSFGTFGNDERVVTDEDGRMSGYLRSVHGLEQRAAIEISVIVRTKDLRYGVTRKITRTTDDPPPAEFELTLESCGTAEFGVVDPDQQAIEKPDIRIHAQFQGHLFGYSQTKLEITPLGGGRFRIEGLIPGWSYTVEANADDYRTLDALSISIEPRQHKDAGNLNVNWTGPKGVPDLIERLGHERQYQRQRACRLLGELGPVADQAVPALASLLRDDPAIHVRCEAAEALGKLGEAARIAQPDLLHAIDTGEQRMANYAKRGLVQLADPAMAPELIKRAKDINHKNQRVVIECLSAFPHEEVIEVLAELVGDPDRPGQATAAINVLHGFGTPEVLPALHRALEHPDRGVRDLAEQVIEKIKSELPQLTDQLVH